MSKLKQEKIESDINNSLSAFGFSFYFNFSYWLGGFNLSKL